MLGHLYPNLEQAQAKSSLKYRISYQKDQQALVNDRPKSPEPLEAKEPSPPRRQYHVPTLFHSQSDAAIEIKNDSSPSKTGFFRRWNKPIVGKRRRRGEMSPSQSPSPSPEHQIHRTSSLTMASGADCTAFRVGTSHGAVRTATTADDETQSSLPPSLARKLEAIDQIIARADGSVPSSQPDGGMQGGYSPGGRPRRGSNILVLDPLEELASNGQPRPLQSAQALRKVNFLLKQQDSDPNSQRVGSSTSPPQRRQPSVAAAGPNRQVSTKYLITTNEAGPSSPILAPIVSKQESQRQINNARVMEFVDDINNKPRGGAATNANGTVISLDKQLRRISLVSFQQAGGGRSDERRLLSRTDSTLALRRKQMFGIYSIREVMAVIRLFWFLDADRSGGITMDELHLHRPFFQQLGRGDLGAVFRELDVDGNGTVALNELLRVCFRTANDHQLQAMLTLAKVGNMRQYLTGRHSGHGPDDDKNKSKVQDQRRAELEDIFHIFDSNGDGKINRVELLEALEIDQEMFAPAMETSRDTWGENAKRMERAKSGGLTKADIERFYSEYDTNNDGLLDFDEFVRLMDAATS